MDQPTRRRAAPAFAGLALVAVALRSVWDQLDPLHFDTVKSWLYVRDAVTLGPAVAFATAAAVLWPSGSDSRKQWPGRIILLLAVVTTAACYAISRWGLLGIPHVADEAAYLWQAQVFLDGRLTGVVPPDAAGTIIQYVGDVGDRRVSAFFPGSSLPLAVGYALGSPVIVNPVLAGLCVLVTYWAGRRLFDRRVAVIGAVLFAVSPFVLFQGASFFGHVWTALLLVPAVTMALRPERRWEPLAVGFLTASVLFSRPVSAVVAGLAITVLWAVRESAAQWLRKVAAAIAGGALPCGLFLWWNNRLTGDWLVTPHRLLLPDESAIFGLHNLKNAALNLAGMAIDFTGLPFLGLGLVGVALYRRNRVAVAVVALTAAQLAAYSLYYNHGISYGPRYLFELVPLLALVAGFGLTSIPALDRRAGALLAASVLIAGAGVVPGRLSVFHQRAEYLDLAPVVAELEGRRAVVFVTPGPYRFPDPFYPAFVRNGADPARSDIVFVRGPVDCEIREAFPDRAEFVLKMELKAADVDSPAVLASVGPAERAGGPCPMNVR